MLVLRSADSSQAPDKILIDFEKFAPNLSEANQNKWTQKINMINSLLKKELIPG